MERGTTAARMCAFAMGSGFARRGPSPWPTGPISRGVVTLRRDCNPGQRCLWSAGASIVDRHFCKDCAAAIEKTMRAIRLPD